MKLKDALLVASKKHGYNLKKFEWDVPPGISTEYYYHKKLRRISKVQE